MAQKSTGTSKRRTKKDAPVQAIDVLETRKHTISSGDLPVNALPANGLEEEIRRRAYELYLQRGGLPGNESEDWITAEREVRSRQLQQAG